MASSVGPIRPARASDYPAIVALQIEPELDPVPDAEKWEREQMALTSVYDRDGVLGFINAYATDTHGYVRHVSVAPSARREGIGVALMRAAADGFRERGLAEWQLHVRTDNSAAHALYERVGMTRREQFTVVRIEWERVTSLPLVDPTVTAATVTSTPELVVAQLCDASGESVGVSAHFRPRPAGVMPVNLSRPELFVDLLHAFAPHALSDRSWFQVGIRDDDSLVERLEALGGVVRSRTYRYAGAL